MEKRFENKTAVIVGGASGMGELTARKIASEGGRVIIADVNGKAAEKTAGSLRASGSCAWGIPCDVRLREDVEKVRDFALEKTGSLDILVHTAGGASQRMCNAPGPFAERPYEVLDWGIDVNLKGPLYFARAVLNTMLKQERGVIILLGSIDGVTGSPMSVDYSTAKAGLIGLTKSLALIGAEHNVRACCVSPGPVLTRPGMASMKTPMNRAAEVREVVDVILFLASDQASFITGVNYLVDGGRACGAQEYPR
ncbi:MAG: SDR family oxidoreductase [Lentisphaeria bacterium]|nr:SDR family oxidoreductase [Lentisphaeria bacterium]